MEPADPDRAQEYTARPASRRLYGDRIRWPVRSFAEPQGQRLVAVEGGEDDLLLGVVECPVHSHPIEQQISKPVLIMSPCVVSCRQP
jgi:hypothetical protein